MAKHSDITNPASLHYAKVRRFTGSPNFVTPDFVNQLLVSDGNKTYIATGIAEGDLQLVGDGIGETPDIPPPEIGTFTGDPATITPANAFMLYIATDTDRLYYSTGTAEGDLRPITAQAPEATGAPLIGDYAPPQVLPDFLGQTYFSKFDGTYWVAVSLTAPEKWQQVGSTLQLYEPSLLDLKNYFVNAQLFTGNDLTLHCDNTNFTPELGEPYHSSGPGTRSGWVKWQIETVPETTYTAEIYPIWVDSMDGQDNTKILLSIWTGTSILDLQFVTQTGVINAGIAYITEPPANQVYYIKAEVLDDLQGTFDISIHVAS